MDDPSIFTTKCCKGICRNTKAPFGLWKIWWKEKNLGNFSFLGAWFREKYKRKKWVEKLLETGDTIFLIKLWGKFGKSFQKNFRLPPISYWLDDINMIQVIHQYSNFSSKFLLFFSIQTREKTHFLPTFFSLIFFFLSTFISIKFSKN